jgi:hypothetical protein
VTNRRDKKIPESFSFLKFSCNRKIAIFVPVASLRPAIEAQAGEVSRFHSILSNGNALHGLPVVNRFR